MPPIVGPEQRTPEWYSRRRQGFGSSEAATLCGFNRWSTPAELYYLKAGLRSEQTENEHMRLGRHIEPAILSIYSETQQVFVHNPVPMLIHAQCPYLFASVDGLAFLEHDESTLSEDFLRLSLLTSDYPVEAKWSMSPYVLEELGEEGTDQIPVNWLFQVQQQLDVLGLERGTVAALVYGKLRTYEVERNDGIIDCIHEAAEEMWERLQNQDPPEIEWTHPNALRLVKELHRDVTQEAVVLPWTVDELWQERQQLKDEIKAKQSRVDEIDARVLDAMGDAQTARCANWEDTELVRTSIKESTYTATRKAHVRLGERKRKHG